MNFADVIGQTLDEKYLIERELGRGGMGTVYLATHLGTERPVAIKIIAPQFMQRPEFVERFRREARAAGRLRHPNVVDVTDFGFATTAEGQVAYLVMEYLDGCTLGEILEEEKNLPVAWTLDILEQVCSAVHEAHEQGIIHRDLKPDNIWLEPNQRGGYTVKVLDFGIAKLEAHTAPDTGEYPVAIAQTPTVAIGRTTTLSDISKEETIHESNSPTRIVEGATVAHAAGVSGSDKETLIQQPVNGEERGTSVLRSRTDAKFDQEAVQTRLIPDDGDAEHPASNSLGGSSFYDGSTSSDLTRVGSVLGTPLYMSPEQCRGDKLDSRSDIYSLGIIAYQMLSGSTPFSGDFTKVMESHKSCPPPPLTAKNVRKKLRRVIASALAKEADMRPQTAEAFASSLRARSEGIFGLLRRAGMIYTEHIQKFLALSTFFFLPMIGLALILVVLSFLKASEVIPSGIANVGLGLVAITNSLMTAFCAYLITGTITWIVSQSLAVPLRPIKLRASLMEARKKWKTFAGLGIFSTFISIVAAIVVAAVCFGIPFAIFWAIFGMQAFTPIAAGVIGAIAGLVTFLLTSVWLMLVAPVVMMENARGLQSLKRSKQLVSRSLMTGLAAYIIMFLIPAVAAGLLSFVINVTAKAIDNRPAAAETAETRPAAPENPPPDGLPVPAKGGEEDKGFNISFGRGQRVDLDENPKDMRSRLKKTFLETLLQLLLLPIQIVVISFTAIIVALLYLKTRQAGGESLQDLLSKFEETDKPRKKWQERVRQRLIQSGRITSRS